MLGSWGRAPAMAPAMAPAALAVAWPSEGPAGVPVLCWGFWGFCDGFRAFYVGHRQLHLVSGAFGVSPRFLQMIYQTYRGVFLSLQKKTNFKTSNITYSGSSVKTYIEEQKASKKQIEEQKASKRTKGLFEEIISHPRVCPKPK